MFVVEQIAEEGIKYTLFGELCQLLVEGGVVVLVLVLVVLDEPHQGGELSRDTLEVNQSDETITVLTN